MVHAQASFRLRTGCANDEGSRVVLEELDTSLGVEAVDQLFSSLQRVLREWKLSKSVLAGGISANNTEDATLSELRVRER